MPLLAISLFFVGAAIKVDNARGIAHLNLGRKKRLDRQASIRKMDKPWRKSEFTTYPNPALSKKPRFGRREEHGSHSEKDSAGEKTRNKDRKTKGHKGSAPHDRPPSPSPSGHKTGSGPSRDGEVRRRRVHFDPHLDEEKKTGRPRPARRRSDKHKRHPNDRDSDRGRRHLEPPTPETPQPWGFDEANELDNDAEVADTGVADTGVTDTVATDTRATDMGVTDTGITDPPVADALPDAKDSEMREEAPMDEYSTRPEAKVGATLKALQDFFIEYFSRYPQQPRRQDQTMQAWLERQSEQARRGSAAPGDVGEWTQTHHSLRASAEANWIDGQRRLVAEQTTALYTLYAEAERVTAFLRQAHELRQQQQQGRTPSPLAHYSQSPTPTPKPETPLAIHAQKLLALLSLTTSLQGCLHDTASRITAHETQLAAASGQPARLDEITAFFAPLQATVLRAAARIRALHVTADGGGMFRTIGAAETQFCVAWERLTALYGGVVRVERRGRGKVAEAEWERYLGLLRTWAEQVRAFDGMDGVWE